MKIVFFGSSDYCLPILKSLFKNFNLVAVVTCPDKPLGRKQLLTPSEPKKFAKSHNIKAYTPKDKIELLSLKDNFSQMQPDLAIVSDYRLIIPKEIFTIPRYKTLNIHFSKLPKFRGPSPVQYTILYGEKSAWITIFIIEEEMDTGSIIWQKEIPLTGNETTETLKHKMFNLSPIELPNVISLYVQNKLVPQKQDHSKATYTSLLTREGGFIPSQFLEMALRETTPPKEKLQEWPLYKEIFSQLPTRQLAGYQLPILIKQALLAFTPWPGVWTKIQITDNRKQITKRLKILKAHLEPIISNRQQAAGTRVVLDTVQLEGKRPISWKQFQEGHPDFSF